MKRRAFTLIEMLVLVAVLAIIAAILFPVFMHDRGSHKSSCQNNLKQIALGFKQYINDFNERYPLIFVTKGNAKGLSPYGWADALQPYIKNTQVYQCPNESSDGDDDPRTANYCDYWYNANFIVRDKKGKPIGAAETNLGSSSQTIIAGDGGNENGTPTGDARYNQCGDGSSLTNPAQLCPVTSGIYATYPAAQLHLDGANFAFADGHVKWLRGNNPMQSASVLNNGMTQKTIEQPANADKTTFSLLSK